MEVDERMRLARCVLVVGDVELFLLERRILPSQPELSESARRCYDGRNWTRRLEAIGIYQPELAQ